MAIKHMIRGDKGELVEVSLSPIKAIRRHCLECMCFQQTEVPRCAAINCALYPFRVSGASIEQSKNGRG